MPALTLGVEEELTLTGADGRPAPVADRALDSLGGDQRYKGELPADQIELITPICASAAEIERHLLQGRTDLAEAIAGMAAGAAAGVHPLSPYETELSFASRYAHTRERHGLIARRQVVCGLHVHVRVDGPERAVAVHDALRSYLPELVALAANAPFQDGRDTGFASIRPTISGQLPRQGVPPALGDAATLERHWGWAETTGVLHDPAQWWWALRLHHKFGTLEVRAADQQITAGDSAAIAALVHALVADLASRFDSGERLAVHESWKIEESCWLAARYGLAGEFADPDGAPPEPTRDRVGRLIERLRPLADDLGGAAQLDHAQELCAQGGSEQQLAAGDARAAARMLGARFAEG